MFQFFPILIGIRRGLRLYVPWNGLAFAPINLFSPSGCRCPSSGLDQQEGKIVKKYLLLAFLISGTAIADEGFVGYGLGILHGADDFLGQSKYIDLGYRADMWNGIYWQTKIGGWGEGGPDLTRKGGGFTSTGIGLEVDLQPVELRGGGALALITTPDSQLGGYFQFNEDISVGLRDKHGNGIALQYNHISCGTLCSPNLGRDFMILELSEKW